MRESDMTTLIKNGTIITATDMYKADLLVKNGVISEIGSEISKIASEIIDAADKWVLPGAVDVHTHMDVQCDGMTTVDDFETGTAAAAAGGTTTIVDYAEQAPGASLLETLDAWRAKAESRSIVDYGFHLALGDISEETTGQMPAAVREGVTSFHVPLDGCGDRAVRDGDLLDFFQRAAGAGALACVHAENGDVIRLLTQRLRADDRTSVRHLAAARPPEAEALAAALALGLAEIAKTPVYLANLSSAHAVEKVKAARDRGLPVFSGTAAHYLTLSADGYADPEGIRYYCTPPLRPSWHADVLWKAISSGDIHVVGSDHRAFHYSGQKDLGRDDYLQAPRGLPGIQERLSVLATAGVHAGRIRPCTLVNLACTAPAKLFGLFPRKGTLAVGSDADMVVFDPKADTTITKSQILSRSDYTPYEGMRVRGAAWIVLQRGKIIAREGKVLGRPGGGEFLARETFSLP